MRRASPTYTSRAGARLTPEVPQPFLDDLRYEDRERLWTRILSDPEARRTSYVFVAEHPGVGVVGFVSGGPERDDRATYDAELYAIYLLAEWQGRGIGRRLFQKLIRRFRQEGRTSMRLWVAAGNPAARFYERMGGTPGAQKVAPVGGIDLRETSYAWSWLPQPGSVE